MRAARIRDYDAPLALEEIEVPEPGKHEVLMRVHAASLNPLDVLLQSGKRREIFPLTFPYTSGTDVAGTVVRTGALAGRWRAGDSVVARLEPTRGGAWAEFAVVPASQLAAVPTHVPGEHAAGLPTAAGTAWQALFETASLTQGQTVLIHAGAGGVGSFAIQLARSAGARVIATASGTGIDLAGQLGADQVIDYRSENFADKVSDVHVVLDTVGGATQQLSFDVLRAGGTLVSTASPVDEALAKARNVSATRVFHTSDGGRLARILDLANAGALRVLIDRVVQLEDLRDAFHHQKSGRARGKIILSMT
jgi:NADPH:quinone reductase-like Zn-dependent oxidoreductase